MIKNFAENVLFRFGRKLLDLTNMSFIVSLRVCKLTSRWKVTGNIC